MIKEKYMDFKDKKKEKKELKKELKNVNKSVLELLPIEDFQEHMRDHFIRTSYGYMNIYQIESKDVFSLNSDEIERHIADLSNFLRYYQDDMKIVCMQFPVNTYLQQQNIEKKMEKTSNNMYLHYLEKRLKELKFLEEYRFNKEFFLFIYSKDLKSISEKQDLIFRISNDSIKVKNIELDKKEKILFKLNNQNSKI